MKNLLLIVLSIFLVQLSYGQRKKSNMVFVEGGTFTMGSNLNNYKDERPAHKVNVEDFYISKYEVTIEEYTKYCKMIGETPPTGKPNTPVYNISWDDAVKYCNWKSRTERLPKYYILKVDSGVISVSTNKNSNGYRLPTEAEWEYAAKGGAKSKHFAFSGGNYVRDVAWFEGNSGGSPQVIGDKVPNELGLYDMSGNVSEWCYDWYFDSYETIDISKELNKLKKIKTKKGETKYIKAVPTKVCRGGNFLNKKDLLSITKRFNFKKNVNKGNAGIRLTRSK